jgi:hypothetical protein
MAGAALNKKKQRPAEALFLMVIPRGLEPLLQA